MTFVTSHVDSSNRDTRTTRGINLTTNTTGSCREKMAVVRFLLLLVAAACSYNKSCQAWTTISQSPSSFFSIAFPWPSRYSSLRAVSSVSVTAYQENDLVAIEFREAESSTKSYSRLCVVRPDGTVSPLCQHEDDVATDLHLDPRFDDDSKLAKPDDKGIIVLNCYGEGWYGQRPIPSLGGGPGYGAQADEVWSISEEVLDRIQQDGVELPVLDVGMAHGEKARSGRGSFSSLS